MDEVIKEWVRRQHGAELAFLERVVEEAIRGGLYGVKVVRKFPTAFDFDPESNTYSADISSFTAVVDPSVPYGEIHEFREG